MAIARIRLVIDAEFNKDMPTIKDIGEKHADEESILLTRVAATNHAETKILRKLENEIKSGKVVEAIVEEVRES